MERISILTTLYCTTWHLGRSRHKSLKQCNLGKISEPCSTHARGCCNSANPAFFAIKKGHSSWSPHSRDSKRGTLTAILRLNAHPMHCLSCHSSLPASTKGWTVSYCMITSLTHVAHCSCRDLQPASTSPHLHLMNADAVIGMQPGHMTCDICQISSGTKTWLRGLEKRLGTHP